MHRQTTLAIFIYYCIISILGCSDTQDYKAEHYYWMQSWSYPPGKITRIDTATFSPHGRRVFRSADPVAADVYTVLSMRGSLESLGKLKNGMNVSGDYWFFRKREYPKEMLERYGGIEILMGGRGKPPTIYNSVLRSDSLGPIIIVPYEGSPQLLLKREITSNGTVCTVIRFRCNSIVPYGIRFFLWGGQILFSTSLL